MSHGDYEAYFDAGDEEPKECMSKSRQQKKESFTRIAVVGINGNLYEAQDYVNEYDLSDFLLSMTHIRGYTMIVLKIPKTKLYYLDNVVSEKTKEKLSNG